MKKEDYIIRKKSLGILFLIIGILALTSILFFTRPVSANTPVNSYCCERTTSGAWCQNVNDASLCATGGDLSAPAPTSCQSTSYCRLGTCVNSQEGTCLPNVPSQVCQNSNGVWVDGQPANIPQCQLGCCLVADQAAFVTQTRCSFLSAQAGVNGTFRTDITDEQTCIASANPQVDGACVLDNGFSRTCRRLTRGDCQQLQQTSGSNTTVEFHEGLLCSATTLATNCGMTKNTECVPGKDQVYFVDSCGNMANVYDASKVNDPSYWTNIQNPSSSCNFGSSNANSASCGNCDYLTGSVCKAYQRGNQQTQTAPTYGNSICADLSCKISNGTTMPQGASWCANTQGADKNLPGSEDAVQRCFDGEVTTELCDPFRDKICLTDTTTNFPIANCVVNRWQDCTSVDNQQDCLDTNQRDCQWVNLTSSVDSNGNEFIVSSNGTLVYGNKGNSAACVPKYAPGFSFWNSSEDASGNDAQSICAQASQTCNVKFSRSVIGLFGSGAWTCSGNCQCIGLKSGDKIPGGVQGVSQWVSQRMGMCVAIGDCGNKTNYIGNPGYPTTAVTISKA